MQGLSGQHHPLEKSAEQSSRYSVAAAPATIHSQHQGFIDQPKPTTRSHHPLAEHGRERERELKQQEGCLTTTRVVQFTILSLISRICKVKISPEPLWVVVEEVNEPQQT